MRARLNPVVAVVCGSVAVVVGLIGYGVYRLVPLVQLPSVFPTLNGCYGPLVAAAHGAIGKDRWPNTQKGDSLYIVGLTKTEAFQPIRVKGMSVCLIERMFMPLLTDRPDPFYMAVVTSDSSVLGKVEILQPANRKVEHLSLMGSEVLFSPANHRLPESSIPPNLPTSWRGVHLSAEKVGADRAAFHPAPDYEADVYRGGVWQGMFAAWSDPELSQANWQPINANGVVVGPPVLFTPRPFAIKPERDDDSN